MLWEKESLLSDAPLIDIFGRMSDEFYFQSKIKTMKIIAKNYKSESKKEALSIHYRNKGVELTNAKNWLNAIEFFNQALCFAENGSNELGSAYANRSSCFFGLKMYDECLTDIKLATMNNCAQILLPKLAKWKESCMKMLQQPNASATKRKVVKLEPTPTSGPNDRHDWLTKLVEIERNTASERCIRANADIDVGKIVMVEDAFVWWTSENYRRCCVCLETTSNLVPCKKCTNALVCHGTCENSELHEIECEMDLPEKDANGVNLYLVVRSILTALLIIPNVTELMRFVERIVAANGCGTSTTESMSTPLSKYTMFLENGMKWRWPKKDDDTYLWYIKQVYENLMENDEICSLFEDNELFLIHLIGHHICALKYAVPNAKVGENDGTDIHSVFGRIFKHSCNPNAVLVTSGRSTVAITVRPIKNGEDVTVSYLGDGLNQSTRDRQIQLLKQYNVKCACERCTATTNLSSKLSRIASQQCLNHLMTMSQSQKQSQTSRKLNICVEFLESNGRQQWCDDTSLVVLKYSELLREHYYFNFKF